MSITFNIFHKNNVKIFFNIVLTIILKGFVNITLFIVEIAN